MKSAVRNFLVFPLKEDRVAAYVYYVLEGTGSAEDSLCARALKDRDFVHGAKSRIPEETLARSIREFSARDVYCSLCTRMQWKARGEGRLGIAALVSISLDRVAAVPLEYMSITGAGEERHCILRLPARGVRYDISDREGNVVERADAKGLRGMLLAPLAEDMRAFSLAVPSKCFVDTGSMVYALLPQVWGQKDRLVLRADKKNVVCRKLKNTVFLDIRYEMNVEVRSLQECRIWSLHGSLLCRMVRGAEYGPADALQEVSVSIRAVKALRGDCMELYMPQMWRVTYKDCVLSLPWTTLSHPFRKSDGRIRVLLCSGMYEIRDEGAAYEVCMQDLADAMDGNEYGTEPRMYIKVPYRAVFRANMRSVCIGLVLSAGDAADTRHKSGIGDFSCIMSVDRDLYMDERSLGGRIWLAVPVGYRFEAWMTDGMAIGLSSVDVMRLLGALQKDYDASCAASYAEGAAKKRALRAAA